MSRVFFELRHRLALAKKSPSDFITACEAVGVTQTQARRALVGYAVPATVASRIHIALEALGLTVVRSARGNGPMVR